jgi:5-methylthioribose kinase
LYLIDWEFATTGPLSFDLGCLLGNLMLAVLALKGMQQSEQQQQKQQQQEQQSEQQQRQQEQQAEQHQLGQPQGQSFTRQQQAEWLVQVSLVGHVWVVSGALGSVSMPTFVR